jgi:hypothetical protein
VVAPSDQVVPLSVVHYLLELFVSLESPFLCVDP